MARQSDDPKEQQRDELALAPPRMRILNDRPLTSGEAHLDSLRLAAKLAPVYDILRHPDTQTPLGVAIYGDWGTGKTSAMRWLEGLLLEWNKNGDHDLGRKVRPVWFYPWKYHEKDDVWRGLIAEVILASIDIRGATLERVKTAVKRFGLFLGRSFLHALSSLKLSQGISTGALKDIYEEYRETTHPERGYLNEFETTLSEWVDDTIGDADERMVIFIDDLDRCLPEVALQVLEALKLYLNIPNLIFVIGVDRTVIDQLIQKLYGDLGLEKQKSKKYLAKMFQIEVAVGPNHQQAEIFLDEQLTLIGAHDDEYWATELEDGQRQLVRDVILRLAQRNPREIKRLLNSALIHGAGVLHLDDQPFSFAQGVQTFLVRRILDERYTMGLSVDTRAGMEFFHRWSRIVQGGADATVAHPEELATALGGGLAPADNLGAAETGDLQGELVGPRQTPAEVPETPYAGLLTDRGFTHLRRLLADPDLGLLMRIEYPADTSALAESYVQDLPRGLIREAIARELGKKDFELTTEDYPHVTQIDLEGGEIVDISPLQALTELRSLDLSSTHVTDLTPLVRLARLESLSLGRTPVTEIAALRRMRSLKSLALFETQVANLDPLRGCRNLRALNLRKTPVEDIGALRALGTLHSLTLSDTGVADLGPLDGLHALETLELSGTPVVDIGALGGLTELRFLYLSRSQVSDLSPLSGLRNLQSLALAHTPVVDPTPLHGLSELGFLDLQGTKVPEQARKQLIAALPGAKIRF